ncbi:glycine betaine/proline transport system substrate-binding protein [Roseivivax halotolerans]|uniref:Glycine betaine/proline transport system substrate-binding protein n=1 Tax=Roseivivax halotolerans TaxID=93684 RepID=A0A1I5XCJ4_9RHOB|nr:ABC transporter substrate-binding protein [Roseivivax halotolerans]SFQ29576.1 glycine betaine/proline transport system substrate-binding protein [Roseivivax halotolerans]
MKTLAYSAAAIALFAAAPALAQEDCGEVSITEMNWASASIVTNVANFILTQGYGCDVSVVPSDTVPAITSLVENGEPDIVTELWTNSTGDAYARLVEEGRVQEIGTILDPGGIEGWWVPAYLVEEHPELADVEGVLANPDLVGGRFHNCPEGWGCRISNDNLTEAFGVAEAGIEIFNHGSGETLATSLASAYEAEEPWFGYYWSPTALLGSYDMVSVDMGPYNEEEFRKATQPDSENVGRSSFPASPVKTAVVADFAEAHPAIADFLSKMTYPTSTMSEIVAWMDENSASAEEGAVYFLTNYQDVWGAWLDEGATQRLQSVLNQQG